jgi:Leucine-rich repeat (LRR) protein
MPKLRKFWCYGNKLRKLPNDLSSRFPCLELLWCGANSLTALPVMEFTNLREFNCKNNQLSQLNETMNIPNLNKFVCCGHKLTRFPDAVLGWQKLKYLDISSNYGAETLILSDGQKIFLFDKQITVMH